MFIPKKYGYGKIDRCPFCQKQAFSKNKEDIPVCADHRNESLGELKCACGSVLAIMHGKFGAFFNCLKCGNMNLKKVLEINDVGNRISSGRIAMTSFNNATNNSRSSINNKNSTVNAAMEDNFQQNENKDKKNVKKEITIKSNDARYFD